MKRVTYKYNQDPPKIHSRSTQYPLKIHTRSTKRSTKIHQYPHKIHSRPTQDPPTIHQDPLMIHLRSTKIHSRSTQDPQRSTREQKIHSRSTQDPLKIHTRSTQDPPKIHPNPRSTKIYKPEPKMHQKSNQYPHRIQSMCTSCCFQKLQQTDSQVVRRNCQTSTLLAMLLKHWRATVGAAQMRHKPHCAAAQTPMTNPLHPHSDCDKFKLVASVSIDAHLSCVEEPELHIVIGSVQACAIEAPQQFTATVQR